jgi:16S rRNA processing protein RimM
MLPLGKVVGHRGLGGELTVRLFKGDAEHWTGLARIWIGETDGAAGSVYEIEGSRAYRDRLVLKLKGIDDANRAAGLRGQRARAFGSDAPQLPQDVYYSARLVGMSVLDEEGERIGTVSDVLPTGGTDILVVERQGEQGEEVMIPLARDIVLEVDEDEGRMKVRLPEGLLDLNR